MLGVGFPLAVTAGFFAAMASVFSKLAFEDAGVTLKHFTCPFLAENLCTNVSLFQSQRTLNRMMVSYISSALFTGCAVSESCLFLITPTE